MSNMHIPSNPKYKFLSEWKTTNVSWQNDGRIELNKVIREYNRWQLEGFKFSEREQLLALITWGKQTFATVPGGDVWMEELDNMQAFVEDQRWGSDYARRSSM
jgi:hypothetical protein